MLKYDHGLIKKIIYIFLTNTCLFVVTEALKNLQVFTVYEQQWFQIDLQKVAKESNIWPVAWNALLPPGNCFGVYKLKNISNYCPRYV